MIEPISVPILKYAHLRDDGKRLVDEMIDRLLVVIDRIPEIMEKAEYAVIGGADRETRRKAVISLLDCGALKLRIRMGYIGWMVYADLERRYISIGRMPEPTDN